MNNVKYLAVKVIICIGRAFNHSCRIIKSVNAAVIPDRFNMLFMCRILRDNACIAMAAQQTGGGQFHKSNNPLGADHQRNRVSIRHRCRVVFYLPPLVVLGELCHIRTVGSFRRHTRGVNFMFSPMNFLIAVIIKINNCLVGLVDSHH